MTRDSASSSQPTARARVREDIRRLILSGELKPGSRLTQQQLAKRFGVAQSVVRESLLELQFTGLVESIDNLGIFVGDLDSNRLVQSYEVREMLEGLAARLACERANRVDVRELTDMVDRMYELGQAGDETGRASLDRQFHHRITLISANDVLIRLTDAYRMLGMIVQVRREHEQNRIEHMRIVNAISENRPEDAERAARDHVAMARRVISEQISKGDFAPQWVTDEAE
ncbi:MAG TPA: GntR family transcriptional regulator [Tepidisphaeraceae bacterium]|nr:GntR family transcriptional regulator [Tepidisphaeraceae bacterium]